MPKIKSNKFLFPHLKKIAMVTMCIVELMNKVIKKTKQSSCFNRDTFVFCFT